MEYSTHKNAVIAISQVYTEDRQSSIYLQTLRLEAWITVWKHDNINDQRNQTYEYHPARSDNSTRMPRWSSPETTGAPSHHVVETNRAPSHHMVEHRPARSENSTRMPRWSPAEITRAPSHHVVETSRAPSHHVVEHHSARSENSWWNWLTNNKATVT